MKANRYIRQLAADERAVSEVIGAVLVFGILIAVLALVQTQAVPATNEEVEFQHSQTIQTDMSELHEAISLTAAQGRSMSPTMKLGMTYPARLFFFNPSPVYGQLRTNATANVTLAHVNSTEGVNLLYTGGTYNYSTRPIEYRAGYHRFKDEPVIIREVGTLYERYPAGTRVQSGSFINGKEITLVTVNGNLERNSLSAESVETVPLSAPARTVAIENESHVVNVTVPTQLSLNTWQDILRPQFTPNGHVVNLDYEESTPYNLLTVQLERDVTYKLRMAQVGVGTQLHGPRPAYLTVISGDNESVVDNGVLKITVAVRDRFNNPVAGKRVNLSIDGSNTGDFFPSGNSRITITTGADGRATATYDPPNVMGGTLDVDIRASSDSDPTVSFNPSDNRNHTRIDVMVANTGAPIGEPPLHPPHRFVVSDDSTSQTVTNPTNGGRQTITIVEYNVDWHVKDDPTDSEDSELDTVELRLINQTSREIVDFTKYDVNSSANDDDAFGNTTLTEQFGGNVIGQKDYIIKIIYSDKGGFIKEARCFDTADGRGANC